MNYANAYVTNQIAIYRQRKIKTWVEGVGWLGGVGVTLVSLHVCIIVWFFFFFFLDKKIRFNRKGIDEFGFVTVLSTNSFTPPTRLFEKGNCLVFGFFLLSRRLLFVVSPRLCISNRL